LQDAVIAPGSPAGKIGDGHQFDGGHAEVRQRWQLALDPSKSAAQANMELVKDRFPPWPSAPIIAAPTVMILGG